ncbi:MAG TPA: hypothetical protein VIX91_14515 [Candidatus Acidoferrum sp.]
MLRQELFPKSHLVNDPDLSDARIRAVMCVWDVRVGKMLRRAFDKSVWTWPLVVAADAG